MLTTLRIENFAIVQLLELDFARGMTAFTGETGAGKSIMIDALMLALGERADSSVVRPGAERCDITAVFDCSGSKDTELWLKAHEIDSDGELVLRRLLYAEGRSKSYINGNQFPLQKIKELSEMLVHIHGQHQHQTLMQHATHRQHLDHYANHPELLQNVQLHYKQCQKIKQELEQLQKLENQQDRIDLLGFQIEELDNLELKAGETDSLHTEHQHLHHAKDYLLNGNQLLQILDGDESPNVSQALHQSLQLLADLPSQHPAIQNALELLQTASIQCEEALSEIKQFVESVQLDPERLQEVESRLGAIHQAARKYHVEPEQLVAHAEKLREEIRQLKDAEQRTVELEKQYQIHLQAYQKAAALLSESRRKHAVQLAKEITSIIQQLGMPKGFISMEISTLDKMQSHGLDKVEYKVCTNPGMTPDALNKIASGGELSRISLAIQMITAQRGATPTLLFDEVDVGIGGSTAALVGQLLRKLGERLQVFCVTHQPQVAASAHHHFMVQKHSDAHHTYSNILPLNEIEKVNEIARMLGGITITEQTRSHARELLTQHS
ncbi:DNA repair protein recN [Legionella quinlivanii]|uniref:DNA repair protein RecN n=1 Tax=Legionella quinlivanii TaxID=45073 RepID=A0A0W0Y4H5_9GAMM|nr:DNA repair protein RecN [Legionella quinlivanii]KTD51895.1 DNA repair protein recN [Legionella quinlivanii]MCW8452156.1 DNA repair protein RecN [Legionella quinlivanii]SEF84138.1 DNA replication and repair protein RecN [Legionella quinlivanii DSM 21216]STY09643.1 DNA repair ATPase [Legionella quinlivanii]